MDFGSPNYWERPERRVIDPERWYSIDAIASHWSVSRDTVIRRIEQGLIKAFVVPSKPSNRKRAYKSRRIQGIEILKIEREHVA